MDIGEQKAERRKRGNEHAHVCNKDIYPGFCLPDCRSVVQKVGDGMGLAFFGALVGFIAGCLVVLIVIRS